MAVFRSAKCIELHNSNVAIITAEEKGNFITGFRSEIEDHPAFYIKFCDIAMLGEMFGLDIKKKISVPKLSTQTACSSGHTNDYDVIEFPLHKPVPTSDLGGKIQKIECEIVTEKLVNIRITSLIEYDRGKGELIVEEMTYCGAFTVWWEASV